LPILGPQGLAILASPFIGSFIGLVAVRLPDRRPIIAGRSACDHCGVGLKAFDLVPIASWLVLRGRCRSCRSTIDHTHPISELAAIIVAAWAAVTVAPSVVWLSVLFGWALLAVSLIDLEHLFIPDKLTIPLGCVGVVAASFMDRQTVTDHLLGAVAGFLALWLVAVAYSRFRGRPGLGGGDPKLFAAIGAWVTWQGLPTVLLYASLTGLLYAILLSIMGHAISRSTRMPFGPHLALGGWLVWLYGPLVIG